jgi:hypothetical protein|uniref:Head Tail Connector Protein n=1 Tax=Myoviridae sp. ctr0w28 TaxID=2826703 RepID=A0A8S5NRH3_9CAUD|nr:MAG TPA: Head Tail Connector Protein [Myoviridae sp. ctr0w28]
MTDAEILLILQADLGELYLSEERRYYLQQCIQAARAFIAKEGVSLTNSVEDAQLIEMYAAYLVRKRATAEAMPRMLRWALNNRLFSQKAQVTTNAIG